MCLRQGIVLTNNVTKFSIHNNKMDLSEHAHAHNTICYGEITLADMILQVRVRDYLMASRWMYTIYRVLSEHIQN
jgi:hypothetical protein